MDNLTSRCLITIILFQLTILGEAYLINRKRTGYLDKEVDKAEGEYNDAETKQRRFISEDGNGLQQEKRAREAVGEEIEELLNIFKAASRFNLDRINDHANRVNKRGWWFCPWCDGSKLIIYVAELLDCKCQTGLKITCKCPDGKVRTNDRNHQTEIDGYDRTEM
ncbi:uncharacterized protein LOC123544965 isoform X2 [Mercenaria mercenaria]|uniref:uncharacterized protein LOC123544965 isoform X2 n=1 Tax=Mercenaria mercenaria TaxID=6596 RepID=UPI00234E481F|nr:uncharacterized protein LOC123544965 isoform X2 [Mercenaria mercenaria]